MRETQVELFAPDLVRIHARLDAEATPARQWRLLIEPVVADAPLDQACRDAPLARAVTRILTLDESSLRDLMSGHQVVKWIPSSDPAPLSPLSPDATREDFWSLRQTSGQLVRPMLVAEPMTPGLMGFQREGVDWLLGTPAGILADDMGLGKTVQAIAAMRVLFARGDIAQALILCPRSLLANWEAELARWAPELTRTRVVPSAGLREAAWSALRDRVHVLITNYEQMRQVPEALRKAPVDLVVADEAHRLRNADALATKGLRRVEATRFWALTGTPIERDPTDLSTLLSLLVPTEFAESDSRAPRALLRARARPYVLRRRKDDVLTELPDVVDSKEILELSDAQRTAYRSAVRDAKGTGGTGLLAVINRCRLICDYDPDTLESAKADRICELLEDIRLSGEKAVVFSHLLKPLEILRKRLGSSGISLVGEMNNTERERAVSAFRGNAGITVLLASSKVASEGLTLTEANHVIFFNEWWNPSSNAQARDRVVRIGQTRGVRVYRFRSRSTIEESLDRILTRKSRVFDDVIERLAAPRADGDEEVIALAMELRDQLGAV